MQNLVILACAIVGCRGATPATTKADGTPSDPTTTDLTAGTTPIDPSSSATTVDSGTPATTTDPCPALTIPPTCFGRSVVYREWGPYAVGDGTYFTDQAPLRLGFTRTNGTVWIVKFQAESDTYTGSIAAYGDSSGGLAWISDLPCDPTFTTTQTGLDSYSTRGGGTMVFAVVRDDADADALHDDPQYSGTYGFMPQLRGGHCYYAAFENAADFPPSPITVDAFTTEVDDCGTSGDPTCYYLAFDFNHMLHLDGQIIGGHVIPGLTVGP